jgi:hypothetical protein
MNKGTGTYIAIIVVAVLAVAVFFLADFGSSKTFASPEEVIDGIRTAAQKDDVRGWCQCLTEASRDLMAARVAIEEYYSKLNPEAGKGQKAESKALEKVFEAHGLTDAFLSKMEREAMILSDKRSPTREQVKSAKAILAPVRDRNSFLADVFKTIHQSPLGDWKDAKLLEVKTKGNIAVGRVNFNGRPQEFFFTKEGESWRLDFIAMAEANQAMPPGFQHPPIPRE